jgi:hypothetical protein
MIPKNLKKYRKIRIFSITPYKIIKNVEINYQLKKLSTLKVMFGVIAIPLDELFNNNIFLNYIINGIKKIITYSQDFYLS